jgi:tetratricopeptide (TPR) repeat protein
MNLRRCLAPRQLIFPLAAGLIAFGGRQVHGQETITLRNGQTQQVTIIGVTDGGLKIQIGDAVMVEPFSNFTQVTMNPPPEYTAAATAYEKGDLQTALSLATSVVTNYRGLPVDWARQAMLMVGEIDEALNQLPQAQAAYTDYQSAYPGAGSDEVTVGMAGIDLANKNPDAAKAKIAPILDQALKQRDQPPTAAAVIGRAFYLSGRIKEQSGDLQGALEDYLRTVALFPEDRLATASAQAGADALRKEHGVTVP